MIRIDKDLSNIPTSLLDRKTTTRRNSCIRDRKYHDEKEFNQRFKKNDTKDLLKSIYHSKCVFCEQSVTQSNGDLQENTATVEHYRPKSKYWWLAYSWDNLMLCCYRCNHNKDSDFVTIEEKISYDESFLSNIHSISKHYDGIEKPKIINPETENILNMIIFDYKGKIYSEEERVKYTINTCKIDRVDLNEKRKKIIDDFIKDVNDKKLKNEPITNIINSLIDEVKNKDTTFIALRYWMLKNHQSLIH